MGHLLRFEVWQHTYFHHYAWVFVASVFGNIKGNPSKIKGNERSPLKLVTCLMNVLKAEFSGHWEFTFEHPCTPPPDCPGWTHTRGDKLC